MYFLQGGEQDIKIKILGEKRKFREYLGAITSMKRGGRSNETMCYLIRTRLR